MCSVMIGWKSKNWIALCAYVRKRGQGGAKVTNAWRYRWKILNSLLDTNRGYKNKSLYITQNREWGDISWEQPTIHVTYSVLMLTKCMVMYHNPRMIISAPHTPPPGYCSPRLVSKFSWRTGLSLVYLIWNFRCVGWILEGWEVSHPSQLSPFFSSTSSALF